jgi:hypothetical protein
MGQFPLLRGHTPPNEQASDLPPHTEISPPLITVPASVDTVTPRSSAVAALRLSVVQPRRHDQGRLAVG